LSLIWRLSVTSLKLPLRLIILGWHNTLLHSVGRPHHHVQQVVSSVLIATLLRIVFHRFMSDAERGEKVHEEGSVKVLAKLIQYKPVSSRNVFDVGPDYILLGTLLDISVDSDVENLKPQVGRGANDPHVDQPECSKTAEHRTPPPDEGKHLVIDHVQGQDTDGINFLLVAPSTKPKIVARCHPGECSAHWIDNPLDLLFVHR